MKYGRTILITIGVVALLVSFTSQVSADIVNEEDSGFTLNINDHPGQGHGPPDDLRPPGLFDNTNNNRRFSFRNTGNPHIENNRFSVQWIIEAEPDPFLSFTYILKNISNQTKDYTLISTLPVNPRIHVDSLTGGSVVVSVVDSGGDGDTATLSSNSNGEPMYIAQIDGVDFAPSALLASPQSFVTEAYGTAGSGLPAITFGSPIPSQFGPPVQDTIGIKISARLTPGDTATFQATFVVTPEPGTIALLTIGGTTMLMRRRRHRA